MQKVVFFFGAGGRADVEPDVRRTVRRVTRARAPIRPQPTTPIVRRGEDGWGGPRQDPPHWPITYY